jgi:Flp pilus assembly protein TadG
LSYEGERQVTAMRRKHGDRSGRDKNGQSLIEFALTLPFMLALIINVVNFGAFFYAWISVANAARSGADYMIMGSASVNAPAPPSVASVSSLITNDLSALPNSASLQVVVCKNQNGTSTCPVGMVIGTDPEPATYVLGMVRVSYTYRPLVPLFGLPLTLGPTVIQRTAMMRMEG